MHVVDTNVLVYAANVDAIEHNACRRCLEALLAERAPCYVTWGILYEFCRVVTHPRVLPAPWTMEHAWTFVDALLQSPNVHVLLHGPQHATIAAGLAAEMPELRGNLVFDAHTVALMREHGLRRIWTRDADFHRFAGIEVCDPLRSAH